MEYAGKRCLLSCKHLTCSIIKAYRWSSLPLLPRNKPRALLAPAASKLRRPGTVQRAWTSAKPHAGRPCNASTPPCSPVKHCRVSSKPGPSCFGQGRRSQLAYTSFQWQAGKHLRKLHAGTVTVHGNVRGCAVNWDRSSVRQPFSCSNNKSDHTEPFRVLRTSL